MRDCTSRSAEVLLVWTMPTTRSRSSFDGPYLGGVVELSGTPGVVSRIQPPMLTLGGLAGSPAPPQVTRTVLVAGSKVALYSVSPAWSWLLSASERSLYTITVKSTT